MPKSKAKSQNVIIMSKNWNEGWKASCRIGRYSWPASVTITPQGWAHQRPVSYAPRGVRPAKKCWQSGNQCQNVTPRSKGQNSSDMDFPKKWDPKIRIWIARRVEIAEFISHVAKSWDDKLKPTGDFTKLGYSRNRDVKNQVCKFYKPWVDSRQLGHHKQTVENSRQIMSEEAGVGQ